MADGVLGCGLHLAEGLAAAFRYEDRVIAEAARATRRKDEVAMHLAAEDFDVAVGPGERQCRDERGAPIGMAGKRDLDPPHRRGEIPVRPRPARRIDAGCAAERGHRQSRIVGERRQAAATGGGQRLEPRVVLEGGAGLIGFGQAERGGTRRRDAVSQM